MNSSLPSSRRKKVSQDRTLISSVSLPLKRSTEVVGTISLSHFDDGNSPYVEISVSDAGGGSLVTVDYGAAAVRRLLAFLTYSLDDLNDCKVSRISSLALTTFTGEGLFSTRETVLTKRHNSIGLSIPACKATPNMDRGVDISELSISSVRNMALYMASCFEPLQQTDNHIGQPSQAQFTLVQPANKKSSSSFDLSVSRLTPSVQISLSNVHDSFSCELDLAQAAKLLSFLEYAISTTLHANCETTSSPTIRGGYGNHQKAFATPTFSVQIDTCEDVTLILNEVDQVFASEHSAAILLQSELKRALALQDATNLKSNPNTGKRFFSKSVANFVAYLKRRSSC